MRELFAGKEAELPSGKIHLLHPCKGKVPIYIAASGPKMLELSGRIADGIIVLVGVADEYIAHAKEKIAAGAKAAGRKLADINLVLWVPCAVSDTAPAKDAVKAHVARVVAHPLPYVLDPNEQKVLEEIRKTYDYYHHMDQQANHAEVIPDWLVDKFAIAGNGRSVPRANRAHQENRHPTDRDYSLQPAGREQRRDDPRLCQGNELDLVESR